MTEDRAADALREKVAEAVYRHWPAGAAVVITALEPLLAAERERAWDDGFHYAIGAADVDAWFSGWDGDNNPYRAEPAPGEEARDE